MNWVLSGAAARCTKCQERRNSSTRCGTCQAVDLFPECDAAASLYIGMMTQWRIGPTGRPYGLDYTAVKAAADMSGIEATPETFEHLRTLEHETLKYLSSKR